MLMPRVSLPNTSSCKACGGAGTPGMNPTCLNMFNVNTHTRTQRAYRFAAGAPDAQLEGLVIDLQVVLVVRRPDVKHHLVGLWVEGHVPHIRTSGFHCRTRTSVQWRAWWGVGNSPDV